jgi:hypothetical protein
MMLERDVLPKQVSNEQLSVHGPDTPVPEFAHSHSQQPGVCYLHHSLPSVPSPGSFVREELP